MSHIAEKRKLKSLVDKEFMELLAEYDAIIAGGAITSLFCNRDINDLDIYFRSERDLVKVLAAIYNKDEIADSEISSFSVHVSHLSQRTIMCSQNKQVIQLMTFKYFPSAQEVFDTFDFTCCMGAYECKKDEFTLHPDFLQHNSQRYLKFNTGTAYPLMSLLRVDKYKEKGYQISKSELLRVVFTCMQLGITSWEDAKGHIGGMYGYDMEKAFDEDKEFSLEELVNQLDTLNERNVELYSPMEEFKNDFWDICSNLFYNKDEVLPEQMPVVFDDNKYLYKCIDPDTKQGIYAHNYRHATQVYYHVGSVIDVPVGGLYFHNSSNRPYVIRSKTWVECEVINGVIENLSCEKKVVHGGKIRVIREIKLPEKYNSPVEEYMVTKFGSGNPPDKNKWNLLNIKF